MNLNSTTNFSWFKLKFYHKNRWFGVQLTSELSIIVLVEVPVVIPHVSFVVPERDAQQSLEKNLRFNSVVGQNCLPEYKP